MNKDIIKSLNKLETRLSNIEEELKVLSHNYNTTKNIVTQVNKSVKQELTDIKTKVAVIVQEKLVKQMRLN